RERELRQLELSCASWASKVTAAETALAATRARAADVVRAGAALEERLQTLRVEVVAAEKDRERLEAERERIAAALEVAALAAGGEATAAETARSDAELRAADLGAERDRLTDAIASLEAALTADDDAERSARERLELIREERAGIEVTLAERRLSLEHLGAQLAERYGLGLEALADVGIDEDGDADARAGGGETLRA